MRKCYSLMEIPYFHILASINVEMLFHNCLFYLQNWYFVNGKCCRLFAALPYNDVMEKPIGFHILSFTCGCFLIVHLIALCSSVDILSGNHLNSRNNSSDEFLRIFSSPTLGASPVASSGDVHWLLRLLPTLAGYSLLIFIGHLLIQWVHLKSKSSEGDKFLRRNFLLRFVRIFALGQPEYRFSMALPTTEEKSATSSEREQLKTEYVDNNDEEKEQQSVTVSNTRNRLRRRSFLIDCLYILVYFAAIQLTLICMGFFQERIVTRGYPTVGNAQHMDFFRDAQFLVFANRIVALALSGSYLFITWSRQPVHVPPLYLHSFASFSNVISSWCQYEALKYVSFPTQTVCKASKILPTMLMGKILRRQRYSFGQYTLALTLVLGASLFFLSTTSPSSAPSTYPPWNGADMEFATYLVQRISQYSDTISGLLLMCSYLLFDAFTPNWQKKLFDQPPRISCSQMMFAVNMISVLLCLCSLLQQWTLFSSVHFMLTHESILVDCLLLSLGSACGQVFIYLTIQHFGPVVLAVIMTCRQIFSIILSSIYFVHPITAQGLIGLSLVFGAIFVDIYSKYRKNGRREANIAR